MWYIRYCFCFVIACRIGFYGPNCSDACVHPGYGKDCQMECNCTKSLCSHIDGCNTSNEGTNARYYDHMHESSRTSNNRKCNGLN